MPRANLYDGALALAQLLGNKSLLGRAQRAQVEKLHPVGLEPAAYGSQDHRSHRWAGPAKKMPRADLYDGALALAQLLVNKSLLGRARS